MTPVEGGAEPDEIGDAVGVGLGFKRRELVDLRRVHRNEELAASLVRDAEFLAKRVQHRFAVDAKPRFVEGRRIIDSGVDNFAVARTDPYANPALALDHDHLAPCPRERPRNGKPDNAGADDETLDRLHIFQLSTATCLRDCLSDRLELLGGASMEMADYSSLSGGQSTLSDRLLYDTDNLLPYGRLK